MPSTFRLGLVTAVSVAFLSACPRPCERNDECDDGMFCNGQEQCVNQKCAAGTPPSCDDGIACTVDRCSEERRLCVNIAPDADGDGYGDARCVNARGVPLGVDCADDDPLRYPYPGKLEVCNAVDEDCQYETLGGRDNDGDGYVDAQCSNPLPDGGVLRGLDCDDLNEGIHPGQLEACNGRDDNCNGQMDEGLLVPRYSDGDNDGWGAGPPQLACVNEPGTSHLGTDCDDTNPAMHPGQFRCIVGGQGNTYQLCTVDGGFVAGVCPGSAACRPQPNGTGVCL